MTLVRCYYSYGTYVQWATKVMTLASIRNTWNQGSWLLWPTVHKIWHYHNLGFLSKWKVALKSAPWFCPQAYRGFSRCSSAVRITASPKVSEQSESCPTNDKTRDDIHSKYETTVLGSFLPFIGCETKTGPVGIWVFSPRYLCSVMNGKLSSRTFWIIWLKIGLSWRIIEIRTISVLFSFT